MNSSSVLSSERARPGAARSRPELAELNARRAEKAGPAGDSAPGRHRGGDRGGGRAAAHAGAAACWAHDTAPPNSARIRIDIEAVYADWLRAAAQRKDPSAQPGGALDRLLQAACAGAEVGQPVLVEGI